jgi:hypothetical protein
MPDPQLPFPILYTDKFVRTSVYKSIVGEHVVVLCVLEDATPNSPFSTLFLYTLFPVVILILLEEGFERWNAIDTLRIVLLYISLSGTHRTALFFLRFCRWHRDIKNRLKRIVRPVSVGMTLIRAFFTYTKLASQECLETL